MRAGHLDRSQRLAGFRPSITVPMCWELFIQFRQSAPSIFFTAPEPDDLLWRDGHPQHRCQRTLPLSYEWFLNGQSLTGGTNATFQITGTQPTDAGDYSVIVANAFGSVTSQVATLSVLPSRTLALTSPAASQEGTAISVPLQLFSEGDVGGMTFALHYDSNYLRNAEFVWSPLLDGLFNTVNYSTLGEIQANLRAFGQRGACRHAANCYGELPPPQRAE